MSYVDSPLFTQKTPVISSSHSHLCVDLLLENVLQGDSVCGELADALGELVHGHGVLVEVEAEVTLVRQVALLLNVQRCSRLRLQLLGDCVGAVVELLQEVGCNGEVITASKLSDLTNAAERGSHDNGLVAELLVVVEDLLHRLDTGVILWSVLLLGVGLVPVEDTADEGRDEESTGFSSGNGLGQREHESEVAVDAVLALKLVGGLDTLPCRRELDQYTRLVNALGFVQLYQCQHGRYFLVCSVFHILQSGVEPCQRRPSCRKRISHQPLWRPCQAQC